jgi:glutamate dehydrogenase (NAD(P)+)
VRFGRMGKRAEEASLKRLVTTIEQTTGKTISAQERELIVRGADEISFVRSGLEDTMRRAYHEIREAMHQVSGIADLRAAAFYAALKKVGAAASPCAYSRKRSGPAYPSNAVRHVGSSHYKPHLHCN